MNIAYPIGGFFLGVYIFFKGLIWLKQKRLIENMPTSKIRSLAMGLVEVFGEIVPAGKKMLNCPFSGKECVYYRYKIEEYRSSGKSGHWVTIKKGEKGIPFYLKDKTGMVLVNPSGARVEISNPNLKNRFDSGFGRDPPELVKKFLASRGLNFENFFGMNKKMRYTEWFLSLADKLYIMGTAQDNPQVEDATARHGVEDVMIGKGSHEKIYYISDRHEKDLLKRLGWKVAGGIFGGILLVIGCLLLIFLNFNML
ncbi:MAG: hypothetical protein JSV92_04320 [archaeon]|nr:MAG: hypothetical protein JSV92_04320 [archaeon]